MGDDKTASVVIKLKADSGYSSSETHRVSPYQWGEIQRVLDGKRISDSIEAITVQRKMLMDAALEVEDVLRNMGTDIDPDAIADFLRAAISKSSK